MCVTMPNLVAIGQPVSKIERFFQFSKWRKPTTLGVFKFKILMDDGMHHHAKFVAIGQPGTKMWRQNGAQIGG